MTTIDDYYILPCNAEKENLAHEIMIYVTRGLTPKVYWTVSR